MTVQASDSDGGKMIEQTEDLLTQKGQKTAIITLIQLLQLLGIQVQDLATEVRDLVGRVADIEKWQEKHEELPASGAHAPEMSPEEVEHERELAEDYGESVEGEAETRR